VLQALEMPLDPHPAVAGWMRRCLARDAWARVQQRS